MDEKLPEYIKGDFVRAPYYQTTAEIMQQMEKDLGIKKYDKKTTDENNTGAYQGEPDPWETTELNFSDNKQVSSLEPKQSTALPVESKTSSKLAELRERVSLFVECFPSNIEYNYEIARDKINEGIEAVEDKLLWGILTELRKPFPGESPNQRRRRRKKTLTAYAALCSAVIIPVGIKTFELGKHIVDSQHPQTQQIQPKTTNLKNK